MLSKLFKTVFIGSGIAAFFFLGSCKDKPAPQPEKKVSSIDFLVSHSWNSDSLRDTAWYSLASAEKVKVESFAYRLAKVTLHMTNGSYYVADQYVFINSYQPHQRSFKLKDIPPGDYNGLSFLIGVDSVRNHSGAQDGALDPANGLYWEWNTGYIFSMLEGRWTNGTDTSALSYHIGLDKFLVEHQKISFPAITISKESDKRIYLVMNVAEVFKSPNSLVLSTDGDFTHSTDNMVLAEKVKDNYRDCMSFIKSE